MFIQEGVQSFLVPCRKFKYVFVARNDKDFTHTVQEHETTTAVRELALDLTTDL